MATLGSTIDRMYQLREFKRTLEQEVKQVNEDIQQVERELSRLWKQKT